MAPSAQEKVQYLREIMQKPDNQVQAYIVFSDDAHQSEYVADCDKRRSWISGFTGSAGTAVVTLKHAALWTDGRYFLQAGTQLEPSVWILQKSGLPDTPTIHDWLISVLPPKSRVGVDPRMISKAQAKALQSNLEAKGFQLIPLLPNLIDQIWKDRPAASSNKAFIHPLKYAGKSHTDKIQFVRGELKKEGADALVVSALDEIAWLFNIRGSDIAFNPVVVSYALISHTSATLYIDAVKVSDELKNHLGATIRIAPYESIFDELKELSSKNQKIWIDAVKSNWALFNAVDASLVMEKFSPITLAKALKNEAELEGLRACHLRDAAALVTYFSWLEERLKAGDDTITECSGADKLDSLRAQQTDFVSLSFDTISGYGSNGAIIHYKPQPETCAKIKADNLYLCDSGGQYRDGTTDVTRTLHFSEPTARQKKCFTLVLQGVIALDTAIFPRGTLGPSLDILARMPLWSAGLDYRHGTGHGVGAFLNVHEGPQAVTFRETPYKTPFQPGMTITDEPGYYEDGNFGIRIENVLVCKEVKAENNFGGVGYLGFEHITFVPIQTKLIDTSILTRREIEWVNGYHRECLEKVGPLLSGSALEWLKRETQPISA